MRFPRRDAESRDKRRAHATTTSWWNGLGNLAECHCRGGAEEEESELCSDWQAEACPTKAVRAALGWARQSLIPQHSDEESMSCGRLPERKPKQGGPEGGGRRIRALARVAHRGEWRARRKDPASSGEDSIR